MKRFLFLKHPDSNEFSLRCSRVFPGLGLSEGGIQEHPIREGGIPSEKVSADPH